MYFLLHVYFDFAYFMKSFTTFFFNSSQHLRFFPFVNNLQMVHNFFISIIITIVDCERLMNNTQDGPRPFIEYIKRITEILYPL